MQVRICVATLCHGEVSRPDNSLAVEALGKKVKFAGEVLRVKGKLADAVSRKPWYQVRGNLKKTSLLILRYCMNGEHHLIYSKTQ